MLDTHARMRIWLHEHNVNDIYAKLNKPQKYSQRAYAEEMASMWELTSYIPVAGECTMTNVLRTHLFVALSVGNVLRHLLAYTSMHVHMFARKQRELHIS